LPAATFAGSALKATGAGFVDLEVRQARPLGGEERGEVEHVVAAQILDQGLHRRLFAPAFLEVLELQVEVARGLPGEDRELAVGGIPVGPVAGEADLRLLRARFDVLSTRGPCAESEEQYRRK